MNIRRQICICLCAWFVPVIPLAALEDDEDAAAAAEAELQARRTALKERVRDAVVLEAQSFHLFFDRNDSTFRLEDRRTQVDWHGPLDRRGFASIVLASGQELPIDKVENLQVEEKSIRFTGRSSSGPAPPVAMALRLTEPLVGLELSAEIPAAERPPGASIKLLDRGLWMTGAEKAGGALLPIGLGEWYPAAEAKPFRKHLGLGGAAAAPARFKPLEPATLAGLGLLQGGAGLVMHWKTPGAILELAGEAKQLPEFPGKFLLSSSIYLAGEARSIELYPLGKNDLENLPKSYRQIIQQGNPLTTLRYRTGFRDEQRSLLGAAIFQAGPADRGPARSFKDMAASAADLQRKLEIDQALILLEGWRKKPAPGEPWSFDADPERGGDAGLAEALKSLTALQFLLGLVVETPAAGDAGALAAWEEGLQAFHRRAAADLAYLAPDAGSRLLAGAGGIFGLSGGAFSDESQARDAVLLAGLAEHKILRRDGGRFYPFFPMVYGSSLRLAVAPGTVIDPGDPEQFLGYLVLGETPAYRLPGAATAPAGAANPPVSAGKAVSIYAPADGGWSVGKDLDGEERFIKNSYEVLSQLARLRFRESIHFYGHLTDDGSVEEIYYGFDLRIVINHGDKEYRDDDRGFTLPRHGFWVQHPFFVAFYATRAFEVPYERPALFTVRSLEGKLYLRAESVRIWHGFGPDHIRLGGKDFTVPRELVTRIW